MRLSLALVLPVLGAVLAASSVAAEQYPGWYGGVDLGYNSKGGFRVLVAEAECTRRGGRVGPRDDGPGPYCSIPGVSLPAVSPRGRTAPTIGGIGWFATDRIAGELAGACARARGQVAASDGYAHCRVPVAVRR